MDKTFNIGRPALTIVANCLEKSITSSGFTAFFPNEKPPLFFLALAAVFFLDLTKLVIIIFCSFNL